MDTCNICFYGLIRSLEANTPKINEFLLQLSQAYTINIFIIYYSFDKQNFNKYLNVGQQFKHYSRMIEAHNEYNLTSAMKIASSNTKVPQFMTGQSLLNSLNALWSIKQATQFISETVVVNPNDLTIFIRPDTKFYTFPSVQQIKESFISSSPVMQIITSKYDNFYYNPEDNVSTYTRNGIKKGGVNDRLIICHGLNTLQTIGNRYDLIEDYIRTKQYFHPEGHLERIIMKNGIINQKLNFCFKLLRENGEEVGECAPKLQNPFLNRGTAAQTPPVYLPTIKKTGGKNKRRRNRSTRRNKRKLK
jgi:hypothetical protein